LGHSSIRGIHLSCDRKGTKHDGEGRPTRHCQDGNTGTKEGQQDNGPRRRGCTGGTPGLSSVVCHAARPPALRHGPAGRYQYKCLAARSSQLNTARHDTAIWMREVLPKVALVPDRRALECTTCSIMWGSPGWLNPASSALSLLGSPPWAGPSALWSRQSTVRLCVLGGWALWGHGPQALCGVLMRETPASSYQYLAGRHSGGPFLSFVPLTPFDGPTVGRN
jgi:hypothetical protein